MEPGTIFVLENAGDVGDKDDPYWAVLSCPKCGQLGLITRKQVAGLVRVICGSDKCPAQLFIRDEQIVLKKSRQPARLLEGPAASDTKSRDEWLVRRQDSQRQARLRSCLAIWLKPSLAQDWRWDNG